MGTIHHTAVIVTSFDEKALKKAFKKALSLFGDDSVSEFVGTGMNGYSSFLVAPCGSKLGWEMSDDHLENIDKLVNFLDTMAFDDGSSVISYVKVSYGEHGLQTESNVE